MGAHSIDRGTGLERSRESLIAETAVERVKPGTNPNRQELTGSRSPICGGWGEAPALPGHLALRDMAERNESSGPGPQLGPNGAAQHCTSSAGQDSDEARFSAQCINLQESTSMVRKRS